MNVILVSYTQLGAGGGVPRFNRDLIHALPNGKHYSWFDMLKELKRPDSNIHEWDKARALNGWLKATKRIKPDDIVIADGFWGLGLEDHKNVVSVAHGNWSHTTADDVAAGIPPEFPLHAAVQLEYRKKLLDRGGKIVSVSDFIADQCKLQWGFDLPVINNGIDLSKFVPTTDPKKRSRPVLIHGCTSANKGLDHIDQVRKDVNADVLLLDEAPQFFSMPKYPALSQADLVIVPSAHEGFGYFTLEALAMNVPVVAYDVGLMYLARKENAPVGVIMDRKTRSKEHTAHEVRRALTALKIVGSEPREWASKFSIESFRQNWLGYLSQEFGYDPLE